MPRIQFTIGGMLWATLWLAAAFSILCMALEAKMYGLVPCAVPLSCMAVGSLFGRSLSGLVMGLILCFPVAVILASYVRF